MGHGVLTFDDCVGMIPLFSVVGFLVYKIGGWITYVLTLPLSKMRRRPTSCTTTTTTTCTSNTENNEEMSLPMKSILFLLALSYLLSPLSTMVHLRGKRWNVQLYRNTGSHFSGLFDLIHGTDPQVQQVMDLMPSLLRGPKPPLLFANRHLQFLPWLIQNEIHRQEGIPYQRIPLQVTACLDKSTTATVSSSKCDHRPAFLNETITLDVFPPFDTTTDTTSDSSNDSYPGFDNGSPIIFLSPGLRCESQDMPGTMLVRRAFGAGFRSIVVQRRGHTPHQPLRAPRWNLFGDVDELEQVYWHITRHYAAPHTPMFLHGVSSGTALVVSALAEFDRRRLQGHSAPSFVASASIVPGYDISKVFLPERFKFPYNPILTESVKDHFVRQNEDVLRQFNNHAVNEALSATNLQEFLNAAAPFAGYPNATAYYHGENPVNNVHFITTPKLVVNSIDDPCCNIHNLYEPSPYPQHGGRTYAQMAADSKHGMLAVTMTGTHCPFLDTSAGATNYILPSLLPAIVPDPFNGGWMLDSWADRVSLEFYQAALQVYGQERRFLQ
ncbi:Alpha beta hydrolase [Seminavis robusta]|uniref:Alpha beta hydrolase n=1 Tax=Seminavis robusta TaxID=568900 RepID=A0A9N8HPG1_9STRA|nr:Alpha beta hydrolase [Seminavis robusta]|eukprot:Sro1085_g239620.1 Alpha beta hydrolase (553) ;mRNA; r:22186-23973